MTWFKVDDAFYRGPKVRKLGADRVPALGLWVLSGTWSADNLMDGFVPLEVLVQWDPGGRFTERLVAVGLWSKDTFDGEEGVRFHDWADWQPTKAQILAERRYNARKAALYRDPDLISAVRKRDKDRCRYCGIKVNFQDRRSAAGGTFDHVDPSGANTEVNVVVACRACNTRKGDNLPVERGMELLVLGSMGPSQKASSDSSVLYLDTNQNSSRSDQDPDPTRPVVKREVQKTPPTATRSSDIPDRFPDFWAVYPRRDDRADAIKAWRQVVKGDVSPDDVINAAKVYRAQVRRNGTEPQFVKLPATWLRKGSYGNEQTKQPGAFTEAWT